MCKNVQNIWEYVSTDLSFLLYTSMTMENILAEIYVQKW